MVGTSRIAFAAEGTVEDAGAVSDDLSIQFIAGIKKMAENLADAAEKVVHVIQERGKHA